jgi:large subunit ribosomal protein L18
VYKRKTEIKKSRKQQIRKRIRKKLSGTEERPRVIVKRSNRYIYVQAVDDLNGVILASASTLEKEFRTKYKNFKNNEASKKLGEIAADRFKNNKIKDIIFDRGTYPYHGRIKTLAESMRKAGLNF